MGMPELIVTLVLGSYGFTWVCFNKLDKKLDNIISNHLKHLKKTEE